VSLRRSLWKRPSAGRGLAAVLGALALLGALGLARVVYWKGTSAGASPLLPAPYGESFTHHRPWRLEEAAPRPPRPAPVAALWGQNTVMQRFRACANNLARVRVWLAGPEGTEVFVELRDGWEQTRALYHAHLRLHASESGRYHYLELPTVRDSRGRAYYLVLWSASASVDQAVTVGVTTGERVGGAFYVNEFPHPGTLDFVTYYRGWPGAWTLHAVGESILPRVFRDRLSQYKPSFLKAPVFAVLLTLSGMGAVGLLLLVVAWQWSVHRGAGVVLALLLLGTLTAIAAQWVSVPLGGAVSMYDGPAEPSTLIAQGVERVYLDVAATLQAAHREPDPRLITANLVGDRPYIAVPAASTISLSTYVPSGGVLRFGMTVPEDETAALVFVVAVNEDELMVQRVEREQHGMLDLSPYAGQHVRLSLATRMDRGGTDVRGAWIAPQLTSTMDWLLPWPMDRQPQHSQLAHLGDEIELLGYDLDAGNARGGAVQVTLYWRALRPVDADYTVFVHALDATGEIVGQRDEKPVGGGYPTSIWPMDTVIADPHSVPLAADLPPGTYRLAVGLYDLATLQRLSATDASGQVVPDGRLVLEPFRVGE
jgi:hypothetical protein